MEKEINLKNLFNVIKRKFWIIAVITILAAFVGGIYSFFMKTPLYASSARMLIPANAEAMSTLKVMIKEPVVLEKVVQQLKLQKSASALSGQISVGKVEESQVVVITAMDANPAQAAKIVNATANVYKEEVSAIMNFGSVRILTEANAQGNPSPINLNHAKAIEMAIAAGLILSIGVVFLLDSLDETIKSERNIEKLLRVPVLGSVSQMKKNNIVDKKSKRESVTVGGEHLIRNKKQNRILDNSHLIAHIAPKSKVAEEYRTIRTNLQFASETDKKRTIIVTSPGYGEGKTTTVANLAVSMAQQDDKVLVVDADLRTPELHAIFGVKNKSGLTNILEGKATLEKVVSQTEVKNVHILTSGPEVNNPAEMLSLPSMQNLISKAIEQYDIILFDSPPLLEVADTNILASQCDGVLLVLSCYQTASEAAVEADRALELTKGKLVGAILNKKV